MMRGAHLMLRPLPIAALALLLQTAPALASEPLGAAAAFPAELDSRVGVPAAPCGAEPLSGCVDRLRVELHDALGSEPGSGSEPLGPRPPRAVQLIATLSRLGTSAVASVPELVEALGSTEPRTRTEAAHTLAFWKRAEVVPALRERLRSADPGPALLDLDALGPLARPALPELTALATTADWSVRDRVARVLARLGGAEVVTPLRALLTHPPYLAQLEAADGLGALGRLASAALPELAGLAQSHWLWMVREHAAAAASAIGGSPVLPRPPSCSLRLARVEDHWVGVLRGAPIRLTAVNRTEERRAGACAAVEGSSPGLSVQTLELGKRCLVATRRAELGEKVEWREGDRRSLLFERSDLSPVQWLDTHHGEAWLVEGEGVLGGGLTRLRTGAGSTNADSVAEPTAEPILRFPGEAQAWAVEPGGAVLLLTTERDAQSACPEAKQQRSSVGYLLRISPTGEVESLP